MRHFGIDVGTRKIGIARSDEQGGFAFPFEVVSVPFKKGEPDMNTAFIAVYNLIHQNEGHIVVLGDSQDRHGKDNTIMTVVRSLKEFLENKGLQVFLEQEYFTSQHAAHFQGEGPLHDASAAALILQRYLDKVKS